MLNVENLIDFPLISGTIQWYPFFQLLFSTTLEDLLTEIMKKKLSIFKLEKKLIGHNLYIVTYTENLKDFNKNFCK